MKNRNHSLSQSGNRRKLYMIKGTSTGKLYIYFFVVLITCGLLVAPLIAGQKNSVLSTTQANGQAIQPGSESPSPLISSPVTDSNMRGFYDAKKTFTVANIFAWNATVTVELLVINVNMTVLQLTLTQISLIDHFYQKFTNPTYNLIVTNATGSTRWCFCPPQISLINHSIRTGITLMAVSSIFFISPIVISLGLESITIFETGIYELLVFSAINNWEQPIHTISLAITIEEDLSIVPSTTVESKIIIFPELNSSLGKISSVLTGPVSLNFSTVGDVVPDRFGLEILPGLLFSLPAMVIYGVLGSGLVLGIFSYRRKLLKTKDKKIHQPPHPDVLATLDELVKDHQQHRP